jgi:hypothetical protein
VIIGALAMLQRLPVQRATTARPARAQADRLLYCSSLGVSLKTFNIVRRLAPKGPDQRCQRFRWFFAGASCSAPSAAETAPGDWKCTNITGVQVGLDGRPAEHRDPEVGFYQLQRSFCEIDFHYGSGPNSGRSQDSLVQQTLDDPPAAEQRFVAEIYRVKGLFVRH